AAGFRCRRLEPGRLQCERLRRDGRWKRTFKLRLPGEGPLTPLVTPRRVFFGTPDDRVYCIKRRNGHRVWAADVPGRVRQPPVFWKGPPLEAVLVVPDSGAKLIALRASDGAQLATHEIREQDGRIVAVPAVTPDGKIVAALQRYAPEQAAVRILELGATNLYNAPPSDATRPAAAPTGAPGGGA
ncbi:MAG TPA: PQQ-binding-like beta-propeller repeat protein, partial [Candidatus Polarisedimenticolaceae bacterium]|nr:PQQ-binding-like beta-propeller repeat protein [Candidatus Polarisedimenticolaceae bacterium]